MTSERFKPFPNDASFADFVRVEEQSVHPREYDRTHALAEDVHNVLLANLGQHFSPEKIEQNRHLVDKVIITNRIDSALNLQYSSGQLKSADGPSSGCINTLTNLVYLTSRTRVRRFIGNLDGFNENVHPDIKNLSRIDKFQSLTLMHEFIHAYQTDPLTETLYEGSAEYYSLVLLSITSIDRYTVDSIALISSYRKLLLKYGESLPDFIFKNTKNKPKREKLFDEADLMLYKEHVRMDEEKEQKSLVAAGALAKKLTAKLSQ